jgi:hypothetical protein
MQWLVRGFWLSWLALIGSACSQNPPPLNDLMALQIRAVPTVRVTGQDSLRADVNHYLLYLDSVRVRNSEAAFKEKMKFDWLSVIAIGLGTTAAIFGFVSEDSKTKAKVSGVSGAGAAFVTSLIAKFRHGENAQAGRTCAKLAERIIETFSYPESRPKFDSLRTSISNQMDQVDCLSPDLR